MHTILINNLAAIAAVNPPLVERISLPVSSDHVRSKNGITEHCYRRVWHCLSLESEDMESTISHVNGLQQVFLFGIGAGELIEALFERFPSIRITAWDRDPWLVRQFLDGKDWKKAIVKRQLQFAMCGDLLDHLKSPAPRNIVFHPYLKAIYRNEAILLENGLGNKRALVCEGELFVDDLIDALKQERFDVFLMDTASISVEELTILSKQFRPNLVAAINYKTGLAEFCHTQGVPLISWEIDPTNDTIGRVTTPTDKSHIFTYRSAQVAAFCKAGFENVSYLPLATNPNVRHLLSLDENDIKHYGAELCFVGASMQDQAAKSREAFFSGYKQRAGNHHKADSNKIENRLESLLTEQREDFSTYRIPELIAKYMPELRELWPVTEGDVSPAMLIAEITATEKRQEYIRSLGKHGIVVWGDSNWKTLEPDGIHYMGSARHKTELTKIYCATHINIDVGRIYQPDIVPMRIFDILSCGGFVLAEYNNALEELFDIGSEIDSYSSSEELQNKVDYYLNHPETVQKIARQGMERVHKDHTISSRVRHMLGACRV